jgi:hypothetical protein
VNFRKTRVDFISVMIVVLALAALVAKAKGVDYGFSSGR